MTTVVVAERLTKHLAPADRVQRRRGQRGQRGGEYADITHSPVKVADSCLNASDVNKGGSIEGCRCRCTRCRSLGTTVSSSRVGENAVNVQAEHARRLLPCCKYGVPLIVCYEARDNRWSADTKHDVSLSNGDTKIVHFTLNLSIHQATALPPCGASTACVHRFKFERDREVTLNWPYHPNK